MRRESWKNYERNIAKRLSKWTGKTCCRVPLSGGASRVGNQVRSDNYIGDIMGLDEFVIEVKDVAYNVSEIINCSGKFKTAITQALLQAEKVNKYPLLIFKWMHKPFVVCFIKEPISVYPQIKTLDYCVISLDNLTENFSYIDFVKLYGEQYEQTTKTV